MEGGWLYKVIGSYRYQGAEPLDAYQSYPTIYNQLHNEESSV